MESRVRQEWIESAIREYVDAARNGTYESAAGIAKTVREMNALPLWSDWSGGVAIRPDGELIGFLWDEPDSIKVETDPHLRFLACVVGSERFPALTYLKPQRTVEDRDCASCSGSGVIPGFESRKSIRCYCGGSGWLPSDVPDCPGS
jgi:hypothetical protein